MTHGVISIEEILEAISNHANKPYGLRLHVLIMGAKISLLGTKNIYYT